MDNKRSCLKKQKFFQGSFLLFLVLYNSMVFAQEKIVSGLVKDSGGQPISGVMVKVPDMSQGTITDTDGKFNISIQPEVKNLEFSFVGFVSQTIELKNRTVLTVEMVEDNKLLDEIVVIGYGTVRKKDLTGAVSTVKSEQLAKFPAPNVTELLRGQASGTQISTGTGEPGASSVIRIRGERSIQGSNAPLFVVDGMIMPNIDNLNPSEIESIEILKDASSQAIYGSRASSGVILVTTKRGTTGKATITVNSSVGFHQLYRNFDFYSPEEYLKLRYYAKENVGTAGIGTVDNMNIETVLDNDETMINTWNNKDFFDWEKGMFRTAVIHKHDLSISGGSEKIKYMTSIGYINQEGIVKETEYQRGNFRTNLDFSPFKWMDISTNISYARSEQHLPLNDFFYVLTMSPLAQAYDDDGSVRVYGTSNQGDVNPVFRNEEAEERKKNDYLTLAANLTLKPFKGFSYRFGVNMLTNNRDEGTYRTTLYPGSTGEGSVTDFRRTSYVIDNMVKYTLPIKNKKHKLDVTLVQSVDHERTETTKISFNNSPTDMFQWNVVGDANISGVNRNYVQKRAVSFVGRVQYDLMDRYLLTASIRHDGASVFADGHKWSSFPSIAVAWRINEEKFLKNVKWLDMLKLRASYGSTGNWGINAYTTLGTVNSKEFLQGDKLVVGYLPSGTLRNPNLKWETTKAFNVGLDFSAFNGRLSTTMEVYNSRTNDVLDNLTLAASSSYTTMMANVGRTASKGFELDIKGTPIRTNNFEWNVGFSLSTNKSVVKELFGGIERDLGSNLYVGNSIRSFREYVFAGIWQEGEEPQPNEYLGNAKPAPGDIKLLDVDGDGKITTEDQKIYSTMPRWFSTINTSLVYKGIDFNAEFYTSQGATRKNPLYYNDMLGGGLMGKKNGIRILDYWTKDNPSNTCPRPQFNATVPNMSVLGVQKASYFRLRSVTLGYTFPSKMLQKVFIKNARLYFVATNLFTSTEFKAFTPEVVPGGTSYPEPRTYSMGINLTF